MGDVKNLPPKVVTSRGTDGTAKADEKVVGAKPEVPPARSLGSGTPAERANPGPRPPRQRLPW